MKLSFYLFTLKSLLSKYIAVLTYIQNTFFDFWIYLIQNDFLLILCKILKKNTFYCVNILTDCCVIDRPFIGLRYELVYNLLSIRYNIRFYIKVFVKEHIFLLSLTNIYLNANWIEREIWDMYGIIFLNHLDLRRILSDYSFDGNPLQKNFPLTGFVELQYDDKLLSLKYVPIELMQDYRVFVFLSPWEELIF